MLVLLVGGCASTPPASPERLDTCMRLFNMWARYEQHWVFHHDGHKAKAELASIAASRAATTRASPS